MALKPAVFLSAAALLVLVITGCGRSEGILIADPFLLEVSGPEDVFGTSAKSIAGSLGIRLEVAELTSSDRLVEDTRALVEKTGVRLVVLGPLLFDQLPELASGFPGKTFIVAGTFAAPRESAAADTIIVAYDRAETYGQAGKLFAEKVASAGFSAEAETQATALFFTGTAARIREMKAFLDGYSRGGEPVPLDVREVGSLRNQEEVQTALEEVLGAGRGIVFLSLSSLNAFALNMLDDQPVFVATEHSGASGAGSSKILFTVESEFLPALRKGLEAFSQGKTGVVLLPATISETAVRPVFPEADAGDAEPVEAAEPESGS